MAATVLIIDAEEDFANHVAEALRQAGVEPSVTGDGKVGLDLARINVPSAIVLCVELPRMSGYSICAKLKKDNALKGVPLVITSSEATPETFEHHKKLKTRAEEYLKKPFDPATLVELLRGYIPIGLGAPGLGEPISEELSIEDQPPATLSDDEAFSEEEALSMHVGADPTSAEMSAIDGLLSDLSRPAAAPSARAALSQSAGVGLRGFEEEDEVMTTVGFVPPQPQAPQPHAGLVREVGQLRAELDGMREALAKAERERASAVASERAALMAASHGPSVSQVPTASAGREVVALKKELNVKERELLELREKLTLRERDVLALRDREAELEGHLVQLEEERAAIDVARMHAEERLRLAEEATAEAHQRADDAAARMQAAGIQAHDADARALESEARAQDAEDRAAQAEAQAHAAELAAADSAAQAEQAVLQAEASVSHAVAQAEAAQAEAEEAVVQAAAAEARATTAEMQANAAEAQVQALEARFIELRDATDEQLRVAGEERDALVARIDGLVQERDGLAGHVQALAADREGLLSQLDAVTAERDGVLAELDGVRAERDALGVELAAGRAEREGIATRLAEVEGHEAELRALLTVADEESTGLRSTIRERDQELAESQDTLRATRAQVQAQAQEITRLSNELGAASAEAGGLRQQLGQSGQTIDALHERVAELDGALANQRGEADVLRTTLAELEHEREVAEGRLARAFQRIRDDEKIKAKARKAIEIGLALLQETAYAADDAGAQGSVDLPEELRP